MATIFTRPRHTAWAHAMLVAGTTIALLIPTVSTGLAQSASPGTVVASPDPMAPAAVTGTMSCSVSTAGTEEVGPGGVPGRLVRQVVGCYETASDPRVQGASTVVLSAEAWGGHKNIGTSWGDYELRGPDGTWTGRYYALLDGDGGTHAFWVLVGHEAYEGLTYVNTAYPAGNGPTVGVIYPGEPPLGFPTEPLMTPSPSGG
jgi:hypothetical protein